MDNQEQNNQNNRNNKNGRVFDTLKFKKVLQSLETGLFFCQFLCFIY